MLDILPQYLAHLTQSIGQKDGHISFLVNVHPCCNGNLYAGIKDFRTFLCIFISFVKVSMCLELVVNAPVSTNLFFLRTNGIEEFQQNFRQITFVKLFLYALKVVLNFELNTQNRYWIELLFETCYCIHKLNSSLNSFAQQSGSFLHRAKESNYSRARWLSFSK